MGCPLHSSFPIWPLLDPSPLALAAGKVTVLVEKIKQWLNLRLTKFLPESCYVQPFFPSLPGPHICSPPLLTSPPYSFLYSLLISPFPCLLLFSYSPSSSQYFPRALNQSTPSHHGKCRRMSYCLNSEGLWKSMISTTQIRYSEEHEDLVYFYLAPCNMMHIEGTQS